MFLDQVVPPDPAVSVIILNWNGGKYLPRCLQAVRAQTYQDFEVLVVDNGSQDGSLDGIEAGWENLRVIRLDRNLGYAAANNLGAQKARGRWLATLNNDAYPAPDWLANLVSSAESVNDPSYSFFASRMVLANEKGRMDGTGDILHASGLAWHRDHNRPVEEARHEPDEVFSPCAAAALYRREDFLNAGGFDEQFFSHHEDVDLGFRLRLRGSRCLYVPTAEVAHVGSASFGLDSDFTVYQVHRNLVWSYFSNMPGVLFWKYLPAHLLTNLVFFIFYTLRGQGRSIWRAKWDALRGLPRALRKRRAVQESREVEIQAIDRLMDHGWLSPYLLGRRAGKIQKIAGSIGLRADEPASTKKEI
jgi:GT2 family glycosyltransferase